MRDVVHQKKDFPRMENREGRATRRVVRNVSRDNAPCVVTYFFAAFLATLTCFFCAMVFRGSFFVFFFASCVLAIIVFLLATHGRRTVYTYAPTLLFFRTISDIYFLGLALQEGG